MEQRCEEATKERYTATEQARILSLEAEEMRVQIRAIQAELTQSLEQNRQISALQLSQAQEMAPERDNAIRDAETARENAHSLQQQLAASERITLDSKKQIEALNNENSGLLETIHGLQAELQRSEESHQKELQTKQKRIDLYQELEQELEQLQAVQAALKQEEKKHQAELERVKSVHANEVRQLREQLDQSLCKGDATEQGAIIPSGIAELPEGQTMLMSLVNKYEESSRQLQVQRSENRQLNTYLSAILKEIETKAPTLQIQKRQFQRIKAEKMKLTQLVKSSIQHSESFKEENQQLKYQVESLRKDADILRKQVTLLLSGSSTEANSDVMEITGDESTQTELYRTVEELQEVNQRLQRRSSELEQYKSEGFDLLYKKALLEIRQLTASLQAQIEKSKRYQIETERYKTLYERQRTISRSSTEESGAMSDEDVPARVKELEEELMSQKKLAFQISSTLKTQLGEYQQSYSIEKFVSLESRINLLQDRNQCLMGQHVVLEQEILWRTEADEKHRALILKFEEEGRQRDSSGLAIQQELRNLKGELELVQTERDGLRATNERYKSDLESLRADTQRLQQAHIRVQTLCKAQGDSHQHRELRLTEECKTTRQELTALQIQTDEAYAKYKTDLEEYRAAEVDLKAEISKAKADFAQLNQLTESKQRKIAQLEQKVQQLQEYAKKNETGMQRLAKSMKSGEDDVSGTLQELHTQLARATSQAQVFQELANSHSEEIISRDETVERLKAVIQSLEEEKQKAVQHADELSRELENLKSAAMEVDEEPQEAAADQIQSLQEELRLALDSIATQSKAASQIRLEKEAIQAQLLLSQEGYDQRFKLHALDLECLTQSKSEISKLRLEIQETAKQLEEVRRLSGEQSSLLESQLESALSRSKELEEENQTLLAKVTQLVDRSHLLQKEQSLRTGIATDQPHEDVGDSNSLNLQDTITELREMILYLTREKTRSSLALEDLRNESEAWQHKHDQLLKKLKNASAVRASLDEDSDWKRKYEEATAKSASQAQEILTLLDSNQSRGEEIKAVSEENKRVKRAAAKFKREVDTIKRDTEEAIRLRTVNQEVNNALSEARRSLATSQSQLKALNEDLQKLRQSLAISQSQSETLTTKVKEMETSLAGAEIEKKKNLDLAKRHAKAAIKARSDLNELQAKYEQQAALLLVSESQSDSAQTEDDNSTVQEGDVMDTSDGQESPARELLVLSEDDIVEEQAEPASLSGHNTPIEEAVPLQAGLASKDSVDNVEEEGEDEGECDEEEELGEVHEPAPSGHNTPIEDSVPLQAAPVPSASTTGHTTPTRSVDIPIRTPVVFQPIIAPPSGSTFTGKRGPIERPKAAATNPQLAKKRKVPATDVIAKVLAPIVPPAATQATTSTPAARPTAQAPATRGTTMALRSARKRGAPRGRGASS